MSLEKDLFNMKSPFLCRIDPQTKKTSIKCEEAELLFAVTGCSVFASVLWQISSEIST